MVEASKGFYPVVRGDTVEVRQAGGLVFAAANDLALREGGGQLLAAGNNITVTEGGAFVIAAGNGVSVETGGAGMVISTRVSVTHGTIGVALAGRVDVADDVTVVVDTKRAGLIGLVAGLVLAVARMLWRR